MSLRKQNDHDAEFYGHKAWVAFYRKAGKTEEEIAVAFDAFKESGFEAFRDALGSAWAPGRAPSPTLADFVRIDSERDVASRQHNYALSLHDAHVAQSISDYVFEDAVDAPSGIIAAVVRDMGYDIGRHVAAIALEKLNLPQPEHRVYFTGTGVSTSAF